MRQTIHEASRAITDTQPRYGPADGLASPRYSGVRTFARLPAVTGDFSGVDCLVYGIPWDGGTSFRSGARFGPEAIRSVSALLRPYNPAQMVHVFGELSVIDGGDVTTVPGYIEDTLERIEQYANRIAKHVVPIAMGGDHSVTLGELRGLAAANGPLALVHLDAHADLWDSYFGRPYGHGTVVRRAIEEGLIDVSASVQAGLRGSLYSADDVAMGREAGLMVIPGDELASMSADRFGHLVRRVVRRRPAFVSFDVDVVDPGLAPGTGTPEAGGLSSLHALNLVRSLRGIRLAGADVVEVAPQFDNPGQSTALLAATVVYELLSLVAVTKTTAQPTASTDFDKVAK